jgi:hypothetical protein
MAPPAWAALRFYHAPAAALPARPPFGDYLAWLARQDQTAAPDYWRGRLAGFDEPTPVRCFPAGPAEPAAAPWLQYKDFAVWEAGRDFAPEEHHWLTSELENLLMKARQDTARFCCGV